jgi:hydrogen cyanide synthase HcnA
MIDPQDVQRRKFDIQPLKRADMTVRLDGRAVDAAEGETVLTVIQALGQRQVARNDHDQISGAYCGMGICQCCLVKIDGRHKRRACQTLVRPGMQIETRANRIAATEAP